jgi:iron complex transport system ATP-binding protein
MLQIKKVYLKYGDRVLLDDVGATVSDGEKVALVGRNGAGKSTLLKAMAGLLTSTGRIHLFDQALLSVDRKQRAKQISWLGQNESASDDMRVWDLAMLGRLPHQDWLAGPSAQDHAVVETALKATQAWDWRERSLGQLSGGERQRVLLARAMAVQAQVLLMDEPLSNLDLPHQVDWVEQVRCLTSQHTTVISVLHEVGMALHADDMVVMKAGRVVHQGACADAATHRAVEAVFDHRMAIHSLQGQWVALSNI